MGEVTRPARVHVLVDLHRRPSSGGHVKVWERLAGAAVAASDLVDLTVHFAGDSAATEALADNVRFQSHRPIFSSSRLPFLAEVPDHADLAPFHPELAHQLQGAELLHTTDAYFAFARTAEHVAGRRGVPLVTSIHTDTPRYSALFTAATIDHVFGDGRLARLLKETATLPRRAEARMLRRLEQHQRRCAAVIVSRPEQIEPLTRSLTTDGVDPCVSLLRRGIDREIFRPRDPERPWLERTFDVPAGRLVVLVVGRLDRSKSVLTVAEAVRLLAAEGLRLHLLCVGDGPDREAVFERLGPLASCPGSLAQSDLARAYASADIVAHPSAIEETSNVTLEALACGRPVLVAAASGSGRHLVHGETGIVVEDGEPATWARALRALAVDDALRAQLGGRAADWAAHLFPSWHQVLLEDLVPVWRRAIGARSAVADGGDAPIARLQRSAR
ncbi:MAG TPA: glycosyltransferase [Polyangia bacterium]